VTTLFELIVCLLQQFANLVAAGVIAVVNLAIVAFAAAAAAVVAALPDMPAWPSGGAWSWLNWALPVSSFVGVFGSIVTIMVAFFALKIALNWVKAL
jgi:hypothetical protein